MIETKLYHCTKFDSLKAILELMAFKPSYCLEQTYYLENNKNFAFPMVCFADLMDKEVTEHMNNFHSDCYIQMSKEWARKKGMSNVIYYGAKTNSAFAFREIINKGVKNLLNNDMKLDKFTIGVSLLMSLLKPYTGYYWDKNKNNWSSKETQFFNEREWRFIPITQNRESYYLTEEDFKDSNTRQSKWIELTTNPMNLLHFTYNDIETIGISANKKDELISFISSLKKYRYQEITKKIIYL